MSSATRSCWIAWALTLLLNNLSSKAPSVAARRWWIPSTLPLKQVCGLEEGYRRKPPKTPPPPLQWFVVPNKAAACRHIISAVSVCCLKPNISHYDLNFPEIHNHDLLLFHCTAWVNVLVIIWDIAGKVTWDEFLPWCDRQIVKLFHCEDSVLFIICILLQWVLVGNEELPGQWRTSK